VLPRLPELPARVELLVETPGEVRGSVFPPGFEMAHVRRGDHQAAGQFHFGEASYFAKMLQFRRERRLPLARHVALLVREFADCVSERGSPVPHPARFGLTVSRRWRK